MNDCRNCKHNAYRELPTVTDYVCCSHPITIAKEPRWEKGDPEMVNYRTGDVPISELRNIRDCPTWELFDRAIESARATEVQT